MSLPLSMRIVILLEIGVIGCLIGAVAWMLFWLSWLPLIPGLSVSRSHLVTEQTRYWSFLLIAVSSLMIGLSCFTLPKPYPRLLGTVTGIAYIVAAVPFFSVSGLLITRDSMSFGWGSFLFGYMFLLFSQILLAWTLDISDVTHHKRLATIMGALSIIQALLFFFMLPLLILSGGLGIALFNQPFVMRRY